MISVKRYLNKLDRRITNFVAGSPLLEGVGALVLLAICCTPLLLLALLPEIVAWIVRLFQ